MVGIAGDLRTLAGGLGILDGVELQIEFVGKGVDVLAIGSGEVIPAQRLIVSEFVAQSFQGD